MGRRRRAVRLAEGGERCDANGMSQTQYCGLKTLPSVMTDDEACEACLKDEGKDDGPVSSRAAPQGAPKPTPSSPRITGKS